MNFQQSNLDGVNAYFDKASYCTEEQKKNTKIREKLKSINPQLYLYYLIF